MSHRYRYRDLVVWQEARNLAVDVYRLSEQFPKNEIYGLTAQLRRAAVSVPSNIAEGQGRLTKGEFIQFLGQARGSLLEILTQLEIAVDLGYLNADDFKTIDSKTASVLRLLNGLLASLRSQSKAASAE
ncbi:MAG TPA: four helix bundle protein [Terriglobales bacterium]|nr:four helix bundle protein [Terriglobales bacterium]